MEALALEVSPEEVVAELRRRAMAELWRRKEVWPLFEALLDRDQFADARTIFAGCDVQAGELPSDDYVLDISRQRGKSWFMCVMAGVLCHCLPRRFGKYAAQEQKSVRAIVQPTMDAIFEACPEDLKPRFVADDGKWLFPNGSNITAAGCNNKGYVALRGQKAHFVLKDESGFYDDYEAVDRVLAPQLQTTGGFGVDASTPPESPGHPYTVRAKAAKLRGRYSHRTIYNHPRMTPEQVEAFLTKEAGKMGLTLAQFKETTYYKREFLCQHVIEEGRAICPEWGLKSEEEKALLTQEWVRPEHFTAYTIVDPGETTSLFAGLHGYYDFIAGRLVVERETILSHPSTDAAGNALQAAEEALWSEALAQKRIDAVLRFCDIDHRLVRDLAQPPWRMTFSHTDKVNADAARNACRAAIGRGEIIINPACRVLLLTLETGIWNKARTSYEFNALTGHADAFDCLVYWWRNLQRGRNPFPPAQVGLRPAAPRQTPAARDLGKALSAGLRPLR